MKTDVLFLTLNIFSATGGIEKVCRVAGKALYENSVQRQKRMMIWSMHDKTGDANNNRYFPQEYYRCFNSNKKNFVFQAVAQGCKADTVILSHINLLLIGRLIKIISPKTKIILMAHGIEIWEGISISKEKMLKYVDQFWAVSNYTCRRIIESYEVAPKKIKVLNNCLDPFLPLPKNIATTPHLYQKYEIKAENKVIFTLSRLSSNEKYKGYMDVITALSELQDKNIKYIIAGKADEKEMSALQSQIRKAGLEEQVVIAGFIPDEELAAHFKMSDCYIMPSSKEGFGIVFIEAMYFGIPVIGGNADGTMDALQNGELGIVVEPGNIKSIKKALNHILSHKQEFVVDPLTLNAHFGYESYSSRLSNLL